MTPEVLLPPTAKRPALRCTLRVRTAQPGQRPPPRFAAELVLENAGSTPVDIAFDRHPLQHLDVCVTGPDAVTLSAFPYGDLFSPASEPGTLHLDAGESYSAPISLVGNVPADRLVAGNYLAVAVYDAGDLRAESAALAFRV